MTVLYPELSYIIGMKVNGKHYSVFKHFINLTNTQIITTFNIYIHSSYIHSLQNK